MSTQQGRRTAVFPTGEAASFPTGEAASVPTAPAGPAAPPRAGGNAIRLGPRTRRLIRSVARVVNPLVLRIAGRRHMPIVGIVHHRGRKTGRLYATPLGVRPAVGGGFVMPLTFSEAAYWYQNIQAAGWCVITYRGTDHTVARPVIVDRATAGPAYPRYEGSPYHPAQKQRLGSRPGNEGRPGAELRSTGTASRSAGIGPLDYSSRRGSPATPSCWSWRMPSPWLRHDHLTAWASSHWPRPVTSRWCRVPAPPWSSR